MQNDHTPNNNEGLIHVIISKLILQFSYDLTLWFCDSRSARYWDGLSILPNSLRNCFNTIACFLSFLTTQITWGHRLGQCPLTPDVRWVGFCHSVSLSVCPCNSYLWTCAEVNNRRLASLCMSLIPTSCAVKCWQRITNQIRMLKRPGSAFMWQRAIKCVCLCWDCYTAKITRSCYSYFRLFFCGCSAAHSLQFH